MTIFPGVRDFTFTLSAVVRGHLLIDDAVEHLV